MQNKRLLWILLIFLIPLFGCQLLMPDRAARPTNTPLAATVPIEAPRPTSTQAVTGAATATTVPFPTQTEVVTETAAETATAPPTQTEPAAPTATETDTTSQNTPSPGVVLQTREINEVSESPNYEIKVKYPYVEWGDDQRWNAFNQAAQALAEEEAQAFKDGMNQMGDDPAFGESESTLSMEFTVPYNANGLVSVLFNVSYYMAGAAHPGYYSHTLNYDLNEGVILTLGDLFQPGSAYLESLSAYCIEDLRSRDVLIWEDGAHPLEVNYRDWNITPGGIQITFEEYQVAPHALGPQTVIVPYETLRPILRADGPIQKYVE